MPSSGALTRANYCQRCHFLTHTCPSLVRSGPGILRE